MPIGFLPVALSGGAGLAISKRKQQRKIAAAKNAFSKNYPLSEDISTLQSNIAKAEEDLKKMNAAPTKNAAQRRSKAFNLKVLNDWILTLKGELRDLNAEQAILAQQNPSMATAVSNSVRGAVSNAPSLPIETPSQAPIVAGQTVEVTENLAAPTVKKGVNWLLIVGVALGGIFLYKTLKK